jgi:hypothetical protein
MLPLIVAHLIAYILLFAFGVPAASSALHSQAFGFHGGLIAALLLSLALEVVVFAGAILGKLAVDGLKINPLFQRGKAELISSIAIAIVMVPFLLLVSRIPGAGLTVSFASAAAITVSVVGILAFMVRVKRFYITHYVK